MAVGPAGKLPHAAAQQQPGQLRLITESYVRHRGARPFCPRMPGARAKTYHNERDAGGQWQVN
jgi:hypothetical protein